MFASTFAFTQRAPAIRPFIFLAERTRQKALSQGDLSEGLMHPSIIALALGGFAIFLIASWVGGAFGYTALLIVVVYGLSAIYFGMLLYLTEAALSVAVMSRRAAFVSSLMAACRLSRDG